MYSKGRTIEREMQRHTHVHTEIEREGGRRRESERIDNKYLRTS